MLQGKAGESHNFSWKKGREVGKVRPRHGPPDMLAESMKEEGFPAELRDRPKGRR